MADPDDEIRIQVGAGYAALQLAKALTAGVSAADPAATTRAVARRAKWLAVLRNLANGTVQYGSRIPVGGAPAWATLEVVTGGFATGALLAGGPLQPHERKMLATLPSVADGAERAALNAHFLSEVGLAQLKARLEAGNYELTVPEEGALLVVTWLVGQGQAALAAEILDAILPHAGALRFYPVPAERPQRAGAQVHLRNVGDVTAELQALRPHAGIAAHKEAVVIWAPLLDRIVGLFLETFEQDWPCRRYPEGWPARARAVLADYAFLRETHRLCGKPARAKGHFAQLRDFLARCAEAPAALSGKEVGRIRLMVKQHVAKHGALGSARLAETRAGQAQAVAAPLHKAYADLVVARLKPCAPADGLDAVESMLEPVGAAEATTAGLPVGSIVPPSIRRRVERARNETIGVLVETGRITSGEVLARLLPQVTASLRAEGITDPALRRLYGALYRAFRRRRSLLLLNLQHQVQIAELPWVAAIERFRRRDLPEQAVARQALEDIAVLALTAFPQTILPNKLLQELGSLAEGAALKLPLVEEVAADIFMGRFSAKFGAAAATAAALLDATLYARYFAIDTAGLRRIAASPERFAALCAVRARAADGPWSVARNGMIIEQQQILTTQNLAVLYAGLQLGPVLRDHFGRMVRDCFRWVCARQQILAPQWHGRLIMLKNTAYAWRQMVFFLSLLPAAEVTAFLSWAAAELDTQPDAFRQRFAPVLQGLVRAAQGDTLDLDAAAASDRRPFLGWTTARHWLLP